jgi:hypothetical protein
MDSRDCLAHYPFVVVRIACPRLRAARVLSPRQVGGEIRAGDQPSRPQRTTSPMIACGPLRASPCAANAAQPISAVVTEISPAGDTAAKRATPKEGHGYCQAPSLRAPATARRPPYARGVKRVRGGRLGTPRRCPAPTLHRPSHGHRPDEKVRPVEAKSCRRNSRRIGLAHSVLARGRHDVNINVMTSRGGSHVDWPFPNLAADLSPAGIPARRIARARLQFHPAALPKAGAKP